MSQPDNEARLFQLFTEIGIIQQLSVNKFNRVMPDGLHISHFGVINHLWRLGDGRTPKRIADAFQVTKPTMSNTLMVLGKRGLDAGEVELSLRSDGEKRSTPIAEMVPAVQALLEELRNQ